MGRATYRDRRKYARIATDHMISFAPVDMGERLAQGVDLSVGGIRFEMVGCEIDLDDVLRVTFNVLDHTLVAVGRVVWVTDTDPLTQDVGIEFLEIDPQAVRLLEEATAESSDSAA